jgi:hypothetical protein
MAYRAKQVDHECTRETRRARLRSPRRLRNGLRVCTTRSSPRRIGPDYVLDYVMESFDVTSSVVHHSDFVL